MSAKHKKGGPKPAPSPSAASTPTQPMTPLGAGAGGAAAPVPGAHVSWMDSVDPKKRMWGKIIFVAVWIYVAALWLLALDQTFHWGIFGPKVPPVP